MILHRLRMSIVVSLLIFLCLQFVDVGSTWVGLRFSSEALNPIIGFLISHVGVIKTLIISLTVNTAIAIVLLYSALRTCVLLRLITIQLIIAALICLISLTLVGTTISIVYTLI